MPVFEFDEDGVRFTWREPLPPLIRGAIEASLYEAGVEEPEVQADGKVFEHPEGERKAMTDLPLIVQAAVETDLALEALTGQPSTLGRKILERLAHAGGIEGAESRYKRLRNVLHEVSPELLAGALLRAKRIVNKAAHARNSGRRRHAG